MSPKLRIAMLGALMVPAAALVTGSTAASTPSTASIQTVRNARDSDRAFAATDAYYGKGRPQHIVGRGKTSRYHPTKSVYVPWGCYMTRNWTGGKRHHGGKWHNITQAWGTHTLHIQCPTWSGGAGGGGGGSWFLGLDTPEAVQFLSGTVKGSDRVSP